MALKSGEPAPSPCAALRKASRGSPASSRGTSPRRTPWGSFWATTTPGSTAPWTKPPRGKRSLSSPGSRWPPAPCEILVSLDDAGPQWYQGEITQILTTGERTKNFLVTVTDERLLAKTGGIVQGMSGCPILQQGKLAGAVTHVFTDDVTTGYGIFAQTMWEEAQKAAAAEVSRTRGDPGFRQNSPSFGKKIHQIFPPHPLREAMTYGKIYSH